jgi:hypothetical protein
MSKSKPAHNGSKKGGSFGGDWHVSHTSMGMGDYYGTGVKAKIGKVIEGQGMKPLSKKQMGTPPKSVV